MEHYLFNFVHQFAGRHSLLDLTGIFFAEYLPYVIGMVLVVLLLREKNWRARTYQFLLMGLSALIARGLFVEVIHFFYNKPRPFVALAFKPLTDLQFSNAFPSGHAATFFALATAVVFFNRRWAYWLFAGAVLMGVARVFVGVHWPIDILGGAAVGVVSALIARWVLPRSQFDGK